VKHLDLFSGIGGFALACEWAGIETIGFVEIDKYCQKVLKKHWPNVPIVEDIRDVETIKKLVADVSDPSTEGCVAKQPQAGITQQEIRETPTRQFSGTGGLHGNSPDILITAGFPCQPFSVAGKRQSDRDDRYLWPETLAVIEAVKPTWVLLENVTGIINLALDTVLSDLEGAGYSYETLVIPACAINAWHRRDRVWIICHTTSNGLNDSQAREGTEPRNQCGKEGQIQVCQPKRTGSLRSLDANTHNEGLEVRPEPDDGRGTVWQEGQTSAQGGWWAVEPELGRVAHGIPNRVDRLKCLGNAIVPQVAYEIIKVIARLELNV